MSSTDYIKKPSRSVQSNAKTCLDTIYKLTVSEYIPVYKLYQNGWYYNL